MYYKIINGLICLDYSAFFTAAAAYECTRGHNYKLFIPSCHLDDRKFCFARSLSYKEQFAYVYTTLLMRIVNSFKHKLVVINFDL